MKNRPVHIDLPLEELFRRLEAAGFAADTARRLRLLRLLHREGLAQAGRWDDLKYRLAPFVARNAQEQERFYALMDEMQAAWAAELEQPDVPPPALSPTPSHPTTYARLAAWAALVLLLGLGVWWLWPKAPPPLLIEPLRLGIAEGDTVLLKGMNADPEEMRWVLLDATTRDTLVKASGTDTLSWLASGAGRRIEGRLYTAKGDTSGYYAQIQCAVPPKPTVTIPSGALRVGFPYTFKAEAEEGVLFSWRMDYQDTLSGANVTYTFDAPGIYPILLRAARSGEERYCAYEETFSIAVGANTPNLPAAPLKRDAPTAAARLHWAYWLLPLLALWLALALWRRWRERRRPEPPAEARAEDYPIHDLAPYYIPYLPQEDKISVSRDFFRIADVLRRREEAPRRRFDAGASVRATAEAGGYPSWRERAETQPVRWLLLVEQPDERSQASRLLLRLAHFLVKLEAPAEVWTHDGRFGRFYSPDAPEGITAAELHRRCAGHRLVLLGEAQGLAHPYEAALLPQPLAALKRWPRRLLLTPAAPADWGLHEALLHRHFWLHPADTAGAWAGFDQADRLEEHEPTPFEAWRQACCRLHTDAPARRRAWDSPQDHRHYLPDAAHYRWLCALAVCAQPDWALTAALGRAVGAPVSHDSLLRLARIPWLDANAPPTALRLALLRELSPQDEAAARRALAQELERVRETVAGSFAQTEWTTQLAVQRFALAPHDETHKQSLRELLDLGLLSGDQLAELDYIVAERIDRQGLPDAAFADLAAWLAQPAPPRPRPRELAAALLATLAALGLLVYGALAARLHPEAPWVSRAPVYDQAAEINNKVVSSWEITIASDDERVVENGWSARYYDSELEQALLLRRPAYYALADSNRSALRYNAGALGLGRYYGPARDTAALAEACDWLARVPERPWPDLYLAARHGLGLCGYYRADSAAALAAYRELLARTQGQYFDSISPQQPVNLRSLLLAEGWLAPPNMTTLSGELRDSSTNAPLNGAAAPKRQSVRPGKDYALFFAVSNYRSDALIDLPQTTDDARLLAGVLETRFGFQTEVVVDATLNEIDAKLKYYRDRFADGRLPADGQLLVMFSGHGQQEGDNGYFLPADADPRRLYRTAMPYGIYRELLNRINCRHVLVLIDACFSVTFDPQWQSQGNDPTIRLVRANEPGEAEKLRNNHERYPARRFYTSDAKEDVVPGRSNFARKLLEGLSNGHSPAGYLTTQELFANYVSKAQPTPKFGDFGDDNPLSEFLFFLPVVQYNTTADRAAWQAAQQAGTAEACRQYLRNFPEGDFAASARRCVEEKEAEQRELAAWQTARQTNTPEGYQSFMNAYPQSPYYTEAENRRRELLSQRVPTPAGMVLVRGGTFEMGDVMNDNVDNDEKPVHTVTLSDFYLATHELTFAEYDAFCTATGRTKPSGGSWGRDRRPVIDVSWNDAISYCNWRSQQEGLQAVYTISGNNVSANWNANGYRLPTEAEWEYAARQGGQKVRFGDGQNTADPARINFDGNLNPTSYSKEGIDRRQTVPVGSLNAANALGLHDMSGNVWEWCWDWYGSYPATAQTNPRGPGEGSTRVYRGGSWGGVSRFCRVSYRTSWLPISRNYNIGFRLASSLPR